MEIVIMDFNSVVILLIISLSICWWIYLYVAAEARKINEKKAREKYRIAEEERKKKLEAQNLESRSIKEWQNKRLIDKYGKEDGEKVYNKELFLDMSKEMLIEAYGEAEDEKEEVSKSGTKLKWYYGGRTTLQKTIVFSLVVRLENDLVVGWKDL